MSDPCPCCSSTADRTPAVFVAANTLSMPMAVEICPKCHAQFADRGEYFEIFVEGSYVGSHPRTHLDVN